MVPRICNDPDSDSNNTSRQRPEPVNVIADTLLLMAVCIWPANIFLETTGDLCHSLASQVIFCGLPPLAIFFVWMATFQQKGFWAISRDGKTEKQYKRMKAACQWTVFLFIPVTIIILTQVMFMLCRNGCADGPGEGSRCIND